jgi:ribosomal protein L11 methyltransferase
MVHRINIWKISVATSMDAEEAVADLLSTVFESMASSYVDMETRTVTVQSYAEKRPSNLSAKRAALRTGLLRIKKCGLDLGEGRISIRQIRREDWAESWKRHFKPFEIGNALLIKPSWSKRRPKKNQSVIILDPGLSFGTGQHPTTEFCLEQLAHQRRAGEPQSLLDVGTGSGILAIAAAKLGYSTVHAFDFDPESVRVARENAHSNGVAKQIRIQPGDVTKFPAAFQRRYGVVCANLISTLLISERKQLKRLLNPNGILILAGILKIEFHEVQKAYEALGLNLIASTSKNEWRSGAFT